MQVHDGEEYNTVAAGEEVGIDVTFRNPLAVRLPLSRVRLLVQYTPPPAAGGGSSAAGGADASAGAAAAFAAAPSAEQVALAESQFTLHPGALHSLQLGACCGTHTCLLLACMPHPCIAHACCCCRLQARC